ncbi:hypothetical protein BGZ99_003771 [Dissophora globulifera]|uniref:Uncharacterized protein n=1 Tax=Dissophora globulifera TaxID=979702 RepID=A0A9P6RM05_9FUNG|nr:hypothetical protein BGZ99_003771 [Dissophora globulifera]
MNTESPGSPSKKRRHSNSSPVETSKRSNMTQIHSQMPFQRPQHHLVVETMDRNPFNVDDDQDDDQDEDQDADQPLESVIETGVSSVSEHLDPEHANKDINGHTNKDSNEHANKKSSKDGKGIGKDANKSHEEAFAIID